MMFILIAFLFLNLPTEALVEKMSTGFVNITKQEDDHWSNCGILIDNRYTHADFLARMLLYEMQQQKLKVSVWGIWGVIWLESRGNCCSIGPYPREYAIKKKLVNKDLDHNSWTKEIIVDTLSNPKWKGRLADLGLCQVVWKKYSRIPTIEGERIPTVEETISLEGGLKICVHIMKKRSRFKKQYKKIPWIFWPGSKPHFDYIDKIAQIVRRMKGPYKEVLEQ